LAANFYFSGHCSKETSSEHTCTAYFYATIIMDKTQPQSEILLQLVKTKIPFGKYKNILICNLPIAYLEWFQRKGFPKNKLGVLLQTMYEIRLYGLSYLLEPLKQSSLKK